MDQREAAIEEAVRILAHYFTEAPVRGKHAVGEMKAELRTAVERIVEAATRPPLQADAHADITPIGSDQLQPGERDDRD